MVCDTAFEKNLTDVNQVIDDVVIEWRNKRPRVYIQRLIHEREKT